MRKRERERERKRKGAIEKERQYRVIREFRHRERDALHIPVLFLLIPEPARRFTTKSNIAVQSTLLTPRPKRSTRALPARGNKDPPRLAEGGALPYEGARHCPIFFDPLESHLLAKVIYTHTHIYIYIYIYIYIWKKRPGWSRCRANVAHTRQLQPDLGLGFQVQALRTLSMTVEPSDALKPF